MYLRMVRIAFMARVQARTLFEDGGNAHLSSMADIHISW